MSLDNSKIIKNGVFHVLFNQLHTQHFVCVTVAPCCLYVFELSV